MKYLLTTIALVSMFSCTTDSGSSEDCGDGKCEEIWYGCEAPEETDLPVLRYFNTNYSRYLRRESPESRVFTFTPDSQEGTYDELAQSVMKFLGLEGGTIGEPEASEAGVHMDVHFENESNRLSVDIELDGLIIVMVTAKADCTSPIRCDGAYAQHGVSGQDFSTEPIVCEGIADEQTD